MLRPVVHLIPHTHWDREWYLPQGAFRARLIAAVDDLLRAFDESPPLPAFLLDGQTVLVADYLALRPERRSRVVDMVRGRRLDVGPWYVLADEQIPAGESLLRNLAQGRRDGQELGGTVPVLYSPDAFGHPAALPVIGGEYGLDYAVVWRGLAPAATDGRDLVWWEGPDGRRMLLYHLPPEGYEIGSNLLVPDVQLTEAWARVSAAVLPRAATRQVAVFVGADHHAPDPDLASLADRLGRVTGAVEFRLSRLADFFAAAATEVTDLAVVRGELRHSYGYTWTLQGVHGTRAQLKRRNSRAELDLLRGAEPLAALAGSARRGRPEIDAAVLRQAWREVVQCHFHDAIGGCSADPVARAMAVRLDDASAAAEEVIRRSIHGLAGHDPDRVREGAPTAPRLLLWNRAARPRGGVVVAEGSFFRRSVPVGPPGRRRPRVGNGLVPFVLRSLTGSSSAEIAPQLLSVEPALERRDAERHYPDQAEVDRVRFAIPLPEAIPGLGLGQFEPRAGGAPPLEPFTAAQGTTIWNGRVKASVGRDGSVTLGSGDASVPAMNGLLAVESERDEGDSYSFAPLAGDSPRRARRSIRPTLGATGPLVAGVEWAVALRCGLGEGSGPGTVTAGISLEAVGDSPVLRCRLAVNNQACNHRLRLRFPTGLRRVVALAGSQFGCISRGPERGTAPRGATEKPVATAPAHRWVAVARGRRGLAVLAPGFFEYEWTRNGDLLITLLRAIGQLSRSDLATRPGHAGWPVATPEAQGQGREAIELGLAPITQADLAAPDGLERMWEDCFLPPLAVWLRDYTLDGTGLAEVGVNLTGEGLVLSACLPAERSDGYVLRCYNLLPGATTGRWQLARPAVRATRVRADETPLEPLDLTEDGRTVSFTAGPRGLISVLITPR